MNLADPLQTEVQALEAQIAELDQDCNKAGSITPFSCFFVAAGLDEVGVVGLFLFVV